MCKCFVTRCDVDSTAIATGLETTRFSQGNEFPTTYIEEIHVLLESVLKLF